MVWSGFSYKVVIVHTYSQNDHLCLQCPPRAGMESIKKNRAVQRGGTWVLLKKINLTDWVTIETDSQFNLLSLKCWNYPSVCGLIYHPVRNAKPRVSPKLRLNKRRILTNVTLWNKFLVLMIGISGLGRTLSSPLSFLLVFFSLFSAPPPHPPFILSCSVCPSPLFLLLTVSSDGYITSRRRSVTGRKSKSYARCLNKISRKVRDECVRTSLCCCS